MDKSSMLIKKCYLCNSQSLSVRMGSVRYSPELKVLECNECGLVFLSSFDHISNNFYEDSGMHTNEETIDIKKWMQESKSDDKRRFKFMKPLLKNIKLLDFGCGNGQFLSQTREFTKVSHGIEIEKRLAQQHFNDSNLKVFKSIEELAEQRNKYDIITLFHVLEHLPEPIEILKQLKKVLDKDARIIVEVPNSDDALLTLYENYAFSNFTYWSCHLFLFNTKTLHKTITKAGYKVKSIKQVQRYPISNHLYWLANGKPGGHKIWKYLDSKELNQSYRKTLAELGKCDTIIAELTE